MATSIRITRRLPLIVVLGATGAGKSKLAIELAKRFQGEIVSADSMQIYKGLDIITNKVTAEEQKLCPHHLLDVVSPLQRHTIVEFREAALQAIDSIHSRSSVPIIVGGTNYYIEALLWNTLVAKNQEAEDTSSTKQDKMEDLNKWTTPRIQEKLLEVDPVTAKRYHPNDRRKLLRALEVYYEHGRPMSDMLEEQHSSSGGGPLSGPLRFPDPCILWVQCEKEVLNERTDKRVNEMIEMGLIKEMLDFHAEYNVNRIKEDGEYTLGIFQSIGFKEFHDYLIMTEEQRSTEEGKELFTKCVEDMKRATRRYARRQNSWMNSRFLRRAGEAVPAVYAVDSTNPSEWTEKVHEPASSIVSSYLQELAIEQKPLEVDATWDYTFEHNKCQACDTVFVTLDTWKAHLKSNRHKRKLQYLRQLQKRTSAILMQHEAKLRKVQAEKDEDASRDEEAAGPSSLPP